MSLNLVIKSDAPFPPYECELICIQPEAVPFMLYGIFHKLQKYYWASHSDWIIGRRLMVAEGIELLMPCGQQIVDAIDRLYTLQEGIHRGIYRDVVGDGSVSDPFTYDPPIPQTAAPVFPASGSTLYYGGDNHDALGNLLLGETEGRFTDNRNFRQQLEDLILAAEAGATDNTEVVAKLVEIIGLLA